MIYLVYFGYASDTPIRAFYERGKAERWVAERVSSYKYHIESVEVE